MTAAASMMAQLDSRRKDLGISVPVLARRTGLGTATLYRALRGQKGARLETVLTIVPLHPRSSTRYFSAREKI